jgi:hypothetical protein
MNSDRGSDSSPGNGSPSPVPVPIPRDVHCPQCGGTRIRKPTRPLLLNAIACVICLPLTLVVCAMAFGAMFSLLALPVTAAVAIIGRNRCLSCGHRFEQSPHNAGPAATPRFPWRFHVLNIAILVVLCFIVPYAMRRSAGAGGLPDAMADLGTFMTVGFWLWVSLVYHVVLYHRLRHRLTQPLIWAVLFILPGLVVGGTMSYGLSPKVHARALLRLVFALLWRRLLVLHCLCH